MVTEYVTLLRIEHGFAERSQILLDIEIILLNHHNIIYTSCWNIKIFCCSFFNFHNYFDI